METPPSIWGGLILFLVSLCCPSIRPHFRFHQGSSWGLEQTARGKFKNIIKYAYSDGSVVKFDGGKWHHEHRNQERGVPDGFYNHSCVHVKLLLLCPIVMSCGPIGNSVPGSSIRGILQARTAISLFQGIFPIQGLNQSLLSLLHWEVVSLPLAPPWEALCNIW